jgi:hypothetical protein
LLTDPFDIPELAGRVDLGNMRLVATALSAHGRGFVYLAKFLVLDLILSWRKLSFGYEEVTAA